MSETTLDQQRQFARVETALEVWAIRHDDDTARRLRDQLEIAPSLWSPPNSAQLRQMTTSINGEVQVLSQALLEACDWIARLLAQLRELPPQAERMSIVTLSGSGGMLRSDGPIDEGTLLELQLETDERALGPLRFLVETLRSTREDKRFDVAFRIETIHPKDQRRLVRYTFDVQRRLLRERKEEAT